MKDNQVIYCRLAALVKQLLWLAIGERLRPIFESHGHESQLLDVGSGSMIKAHETMSQVQQREKNLDPARED